MPVSYYYNVMHEAVIYAENQKKHCKFCLVWLWTGESEGTMQW